jgi:hypothetical protein
LRKKAKFCFIGLILLLGFSTTKAQSFSLETPVIIPTGITAYLFKPSIGVEGAKHIDINDRFRLGILVGFFQLRPTQDTFNTYAIGGLNAPNLLPGWEVIHSYNVLYSGFSLTYKVLEGNLTPIIGLDFNVDLILLHDDVFIDTYILANSNYDTFYNFSAIPRLGAQYKYDDTWLFSAGCGMSVCFGGTQGFQTFVKPYIGATYTFK